jgi:tetratricopeptide (TPR) repeat protein
MSEFQCSWPLDDDNIISGRGALDSGRYDEAIEYLTKAITHNKYPHLVLEAYGYRAIAYEWNGQPHEAIKDLDMQIALLERGDTPSDNQYLAGTYSYRASIKFKIKDYQGALDDYTAALPYSDQYSVNPRLQCIFLLERYQDIIAETTALLNQADAALRSQGWWYYDLRGQAYFHLNQHDQALADFNEARKIQGYVLVDSAITYMKSNLHPPYESGWTEEK